MRFGLRRAVIVGSSALLLVISGPASSVGAQQALVGPAVQVSPANMAAGNITFHGLVANCMSGQGPSRVAVYDGLDAAAPYVADAAIAPSTDIGAACGGQSGVTGRSFTLILNSRLLADGPHTLAFVAEYPDGTSAIAGTQLVLQNVLPYQKDDGSD